MSENVTSLDLKKTEQSYSKEIRERVKQAARVNDENIGTLVGNLLFANFDGFTLTGRLGYDNGLNVSLDTSEVYKVKEDDILLVKYCVIFPADFYGVLSNDLDLFLNHMKQNKKIKDYDNAICWAYSEAARKLLDDENAQNGMPVYLMIAQPNKSPPGINGHHFESAEVRVFLLKHAPLDPALGGYIGRNNGRRGRDGERLI
jgi:hypothetical protein